MILYASSFVRVALVSPYSWAYQGGVNRHVEALAEEFLGRGHHVRVLAPFDPPGRLSRALHRAAPEAREAPEYLIPLGRTMGFPANGAVSNLAPFPAGGVRAPRRELRRDRYDVVHVHEPLVPLVGWNAALGSEVPAVGTFHAYSTKAIPNHIATALGARRVFNRLSARIAVSEAAAWTGRRWYGGHYEIDPQRSRPRRGAQRPQAVRRGAAGRSSSAARRSARGCRSCSPPSEPWSSTCPAA